MVPAAEEVPSLQRLQGWRCSSSSSCSQCFYHGTARDWAAGLVLLQAVRLLLLLPPKLEEVTCWLLLLGQLLQKRHQLPAQRAPLPAPRPAVEELPPYPCLPSLCPRQTSHRAYKAHKEDTVVAEERGLLDSDLYAKVPANCCFPPVTVAF